MGRLTRTTIKPKRKYIIPGRQGWSSSEKIELKNIIEKINAKSKKIKLKIREDGKKEDGSQIKYPIEIIPLTKEAKKIEEAFKEITSLFEGVKNGYKRTTGKPLSRNSNKREKRFKRMDRS